MPTCALPHVPSRPMAIAQGAARPVGMLAVALALLVALAAGASAQGENTPPVANDDMVAAVANACLTIDVTGNDADADAEALTVGSIEQSPSQGTLDGSRYGEGIIVYCAVAGYHGADSFAYTAFDGTDYSNAATVTITAVNTAPVAGDDDMGTIQEGECVSVDASLTDDDAEGDALTLVTASATGTGHGYFSFFDWPVVEYCNSFADPIDLTETATYTISDGIETAQGTITVRVVNDPYNDAPTPYPDYADVEQDRCVDIDVLANDTDPTDDPMIVDEIQSVNPYVGSVEILSDSSVRFCIDAGEVTDGTVVDILYVANDGDAAIPGHAYVTVVAPTNRAPVATAPADQASDEGEAVAFDLGSFEDADGVSWSVTVDWGDGSDDDTRSASAAGALGTFTHRYDADGAYVATVTVEDDASLVGSAAFAVAVANVAPEIGSGYAQTPNERESRSIGLPAFSDPGVDDVLWTVDVDWGDGSSVEQFTTADENVYVDREHTFASDGTYTVTYTVTDGDGDSDTTTFDIEVLNLDPVAGDDAIQVPQGGRIIFRVTNNDFNPGFGDLRIIDVTQPVTLGTVSIEEYAFRLDYQAPMDAFGTDQITYTVENSFGGTDAAVVSIEVVEGLACVDDAVTVLSNRSLDFDVLDNDPGLDGDTPPSIQENLAGLMGTLTVVENTTWSPRRYTPPQGFAGVEVYTYENRVEKDGSNLICGATVTLTIVNVPPVARTDTLVLSQGSYGYVDAFANDEDPNGDELQMTDSFSGSEYGWVFFEGAYVPGRYYYMASDEYVGDDSFTYVVNSLGGSVTGTVEVQILAGAECFADGATTTKGSAVTILPLVNDNDREGDPFTIVDVWEPQYGTATIDGTANAIVYTPEAGFVGTDTFTYTKTDGSNVSCRAEVTVEVADLTPIVTAPPDQTAVEGKVKRFGFGTFADPNGAGAGPWDVTVDWGDGSSQYVASLTSMGSLGSSLHTFPADGDVTVTVSVENAAGLTGSATFTVVVSNAAPTLVAGYNQTVIQGRSTMIRVGYFVDPGSVAPWTVTVDWGDATPPQSFPVSTTGNVNALHTYAAEGSYPVTVVVADGEGASSPSRGFTVTVVNAPPTLVATYNQQVAQGRSTSIGLGYFVDPGSVAPWTVTVDWGDGTVEAPAIESFSAGAPGTIRAAHSYATVGTFPATVHVTDGQGARSVTRSFTVTSANAPPILAAGSNRTVTRGVTTTLALGYFSDPASGVPWAVTVDWGDGAAGAPAVETFSVGTAGNIRAAHAYATAGSYPVAVFVTDGDGARSVSRSFTVTAANAAPTLAAGSSQTVRRGAPASINLGYFIDPGSAAPWTVTVGWGDGTTPAESVQVSATGTIRAPHAYAAPGSYAVTVYVSDGEGGRSVSRTFTVTVT